MGKKKTDSDTLMIPDIKRMKDEGKRICKTFIPLLKLKKDRLPRKKLSGDDLTIRSVVDGQEITFTFDENCDVSDQIDDYVGRFIDTLRIIARADANAGTYLILKYYAGRTDDDLVYDMNMSKKMLNGVKTNAYYMIAYMAGYRYTIDILAHDDEQEGKRGGKLR